MDPAELRSEAGFQDALPGGKTRVEANEAGAPGREAGLASPVARVAVEGQGGRGKAGHALDPSPLAAVFRDLDPRPRHPGPVV